MSEILYVLRKSLIDWANFVMDVALEELRSKAGGKTRFASPPKCVYMFGRREKKLTKKALSS